MLSDSFRKKLYNLATSINLGFEEKALTYVVFSFVLSDDNISINVYIEEMEKYIEIEIIHKTHDGNTSYTSRVLPYVESKSVNVFEYASEFMSKKDFDEKKGLYLKKYSSFWHRKDSVYSDLIADMYCDLILHVYRKIVV